MPELEIQFCGSQGRRSGGIEWVGVGGLIFSFLGGSENGFWDLL